jgi:hypothetical protein
MASAFHSMRAQVQFHLGVAEGDGSETRALCGIEDPQFLVDVKHAVCLRAEELCLECKAAIKREERISGSL